MRTEDGTGSGYAIRDFNDVSLLSSKDVTTVAMQKAQASKSAQAIEPGKYTVILEPTAAGDLLRLMFGLFSSRDFFAYKKDI